MWNQYYNNPYNYNYSYPPVTPMQNPNITTQYQQSQTGQNQNNIIWVNGKENVRTMQLQPKSSVILLDSEKNKFYIKTTDDIGLGRIRTFDYVEQKQQDNNNSNTTQTTDMSNYVTKQELKETLDAIKGELNKNEQSLSTVTKSTAKF